MARKAASKKQNLVDLTETKASFDVVAATETSTATDEPTLGRKMRRDAIASTLEQEIVEGILRPGERLEERLLAERFGVSRTPIREALNWLASAGLVKDSGRLGTHVSQLSLPDLFETFEVMCELEGLCAKFSAQRMNDSEREALRQLGAQLREASRGDLDDYAKLNLALHNAVLEGAHNAVLQEVARQVRRRIMPYRRYTFSFEGRLRASADEHSAIIDAICGGDADRAYAEMRSHVDIRRLESADFVAFLARIVV